MPTPAFSLPGITTEQLADEWWRLNNLYHVLNEDGDDLIFRLNPMQKRLYDNMWYWNIILKARQLGFTTFIQIFMLDRAIFNKNTHAGTIAHTHGSVEDIFDNKIMYAYNNLPAALKAHIRPDTKNAKELKLSNGSSIRVARSLRGSTLQYLHVSEYGITCAQAADKALEIKTGALKTVHQGNFIFIESTAQGTFGDFYNKCMVAKRNTEAAERGLLNLTRMDYRYHFFPWHENPSYIIHDHVDISAEDNKYFKKLEKDLDMVLSAGHKRYYVKQKEDLGEKIKEEYPSTPEEAFEKTIKGAIFGVQMTETRMADRVCALPHERGIPVNTFWDLGHNDVNAIWFHQRVGTWDHFIHYYEHRLVDITHYVEYMLFLEREKKYRWGTLYLPHDGKSRHIEAVDGSAEDILRNNGFSVVVVDRPIRKNLSIEPTRRAFRHCRFDREGCKEGLTALDGYVYTWDEEHQTFRKTPAHNHASNGADAFQTYGFGYATMDAERDEMHGQSKSEQTYRRKLRHGGNSPSLAHVV